MLTAVGYILGELQVHAVRQGRQAQRNLIVGPWIRQHAHMHVQSVSIVAELHVAVVASQSVAEAEQRTISCATCEEEPIDDPSYTVPSDMQRHETASRSLRPRVSRDTECSKSVEESPLKGSTPFTAEAMLRAAPVVAEPSVLDVASCTPPDDP